VYIVTPMNEMSQPLQVIFTIAPPIRG